MLPQDANGSVRDYYALSMNPISSKAQPKRDCIRPNASSVKEKMALIAALLRPVRAIRRLLARVTAHRGKNQKLCMNR